MEKDTSKFFKRAVEECEENEENLTYDEIVERDELIDIVDEEDPESYDDEQEYDEDNEDGDEYCCIGTGAWDDFDYCCNKFSAYSDKILNGYDSYDAIKRNLVEEDLLRLQRVLSDILYHTTGYRG